MSVIQYYFPSVDKNSLGAGGGKVTWPDSPAGKYLAMVLEDARTTPGDIVLADVVQNGPDSGSGVVVTPVRVDEHTEEFCYYKPERQEWQDFGGIWLGACTEHPVTSLDLMRKRAYLGYFVRTECDDQFLVPVARANRLTSVTLPRDIVFGNNGAPQKRIKQRYKHLWTIAEELTRWYEEPSNKELAANDEVFRIAASLKALAVNYRIAEHEIDFLQNLGRTVLDDSTVDAICQSLAGRSLVEEAKKNDSQPEDGPAASNSSVATAGQKEGSRNTVPAGET